MSPISPEVLKILQGRAWASSAGALKHDPSAADPPVVRADGYGAAYSSTLVPEQESIQGRWNEFDSAIIDIYEAGVPFYDALINYPADAMTNEAGVLSQALVENGPGTSNAISPSADTGGTTWARVSGTQSPPAAPSQPTATSNAPGTLDVSWNCPLDGGAALIRFEFQYKNAGTSWTTAQDVNTTVPFTRLTGLTNGQALEFRVKAVNAIGTSSDSPTGTGTPTASVPDGGSLLALRATGGDGEADLTWLDPDDGGSTIQLFRVQWRTDVQSFSSSRQRSVTSGTADTVPSLTNGTEYFFRVRAVNGVGNSAWSNVTSATPEAPIVTPTPPPDTVPDALDAPDRDVIDFETILWSWSLPDDDGGQSVTGYDIQWRVQGNNWSGNIIARTESCYLHENRSESTTYEARVRARNSVGNSSWSSETAATTPAEPVAPVAPADTRPDTLDAPDRDVIDFETILWSWSLPDDDGGQSVTGYTIQWRVQGSGWSGNIITLTESCYLHESLDESTTYEARVAARNSIGNSFWSSETAATTPAEPVTPTPPADTVPDAPTAIEGTLRQTLAGLAVDWSWVPADDGGAQITSFTLQWRYQGSGWSGNIVTTARGCETIELPATVGVVEARVRAVNAIGAGAFSLTSPGTPVGSAPGGGSTLALRATGGDGEAELNWLEPDDGGSTITVYNVQWRSSSQSFSSSRQVSVTTESYTRTGLTNGTAYFFQVRAVNGVGTSTWSNEATATPQVSIIGGGDHLVMCGWHCRSHG